MQTKSLLSNQRYEDIKQEVFNLLEECPNITYPINPQTVAQKMLYILRPYSSLELGDYIKATNISDDAFSRPEINPQTGMYEYVIYFNDYRDTPERIAWSIAHEIGHIYLGHHDLPEDKSQELEANFFAKYLMAPPPLIHTANCHNYKDIARQFNLSQQAARYAYKYYYSWLHKGPKDYTYKELKLINAFGQCFAV